MFERRAMFENELSRTLMSAKRTMLVRSRTITHSRVSMTIILVGMMAAGLSLLVGVKPLKATVPGTNSLIAYSSFDAILSS